MPRRSPHLPLALLPALLVIAMTVTALLLVASHLNRQTAIQSQSRVEYRARLMAQRIALFVDRRVREAQLLALDAALADGQPREVMRQRLDAVQQTAPGVAWIGRTDAQGRVLAGSAGLLDGQSIAGQPVFARALGGLHVGDLHPADALAALLPAAGGSEGDGQLADIGVPMHDRAGRTVGVLAMHIHREAIEDLVRRTTQDDDAALGLRLFVFDRDWQRRVITIGTEVPGELLPEIRRAAQAGGPSPQFAHGGERWTYAVTGTAPEFPRPTLGWHVVALQSLDTAAAPQRELLWQMSLAGGLLALSFGGLGYLASSRLIRPYRKLLANVARHADLAGAKDAGSLTRHIDALSAELRRWLPAAAADLAPGDQVLRQIGRDIDQLRRVLDQLPVAVMAQDTEGRWSYWNSRCEQLLGWSSVEVHGAVPAELWPEPALVPGWLAAAPGELGNRPSRGEDRLTDRAGAVRVVQWKRSVLHDAEQRPTGWLTTLHDVTRQHADHLQLRVAATAFEQQEGIVVTDPGGLILRVNSAFSAITGYSSDDVVGRSTELLQSDRQDSAFYDTRNAQLRSLGRWSGQVWNRRKNGEVFPEWLEITAVRDADGVLTHYVASFIDVTERERTEQAMHETQNELSALTRRLLEQEKLTTQRVAQALHDRLGQTLAAAVLQVGLVQVSRAHLALPVELQGVCERLSGLLHEAVAEVRRMLIELRPPLLDQDGLCAALDNELAIWGSDARRAGTDLSLRISLAARDQRWPAEVEYAVFMIAREAVFNALSHAASGSVAVALDGDASHLVLHVADDGRGLSNGEQEARATRAGHLGRVGMRERAAAIGARLRWISAAGAGTTVELLWEAT